MDIQDDRQGRSDEQKPIISANRIKFKFQANFWIMARNIEPMQLSLQQWAEKWGLNL